MKPTARLPWLALSALGLVTIAAYGACYYSFSALIDPIAASTRWSAAWLGASFQAELPGFAITYTTGCGLTGALGFYRITQTAAARAGPGRADRAIIWVTIAGALASTAHLPLTSYLTIHLGWRAAIRPGHGTAAH